MCCTFNLEAAEKLFVKGPFTDSIKRLQDRDYNLSFGEKEKLDKGEPRPRAGRSKGLTLILDAHSDLVTTSSVNDDIDGFFAVVDSSNQYPMTYRKASFIRPGHNNIVALKVIKIFIFDCDGKQMVMCS